MRGFCILYWLFGLGIVVESPKPALGRGLVTDSPPAALSGNPLLYLNFSFSFVRLENKVSQHKYKEDGMFNMHYR